MSAWHFYYTQKSQSCTQKISNFSLDTTWLFWPIKNISYFNNTHSKWLLIFWPIKNISYFNDTHTNQLLIFWQSKKSGILTTHTSSSYLFYWLSKILSYTLFSIFHEISQRPSHVSFYFYSFFWVSFLQTIPVLIFYKY